MIQERFVMTEVKPNSYLPLYALHKNIVEGTLTETQISLVFIRASQINGCAFCIQMHVREAIEKGEKQYRIHALNAWEHSPYFTEEEQVMLEVVERVTLISEKGISNELYTKAVEILGEEKLADVIMATISINAWNRIGISTMLEPTKAQD